MRNEHEILQSVVVVLWILIFFCVFSLQQEHTQAKLLNKHCQWLLIQADIFDKVCIYWVTLFTTVRWTAKKRWKRTWMNMSPKITRLCQQKYDSKIVTYYYFCFSFSFCYCHCHTDCFQCMLSVLVCFIVFFYIFFSVSFFASFKSFSILFFRIQNIKQNEKPFYMEQKGSG